LRDGRRNTPGRRREGEAAGPLRQLEPDAAAEKSPPASGRDRRPGWHARERHGSLQRHRPARFRIVVQRLTEGDPESEDEEEQSGTEAPARDLLTATTPPARVPLQR